MWYRPSPACIDSPEAFWLQTNWLNSVRALHLNIMGTALPTVEAANPTTPAALLTNSVLAVRVRSTHCVMLCGQIVRLVNAISCSFGGFYWLLPPLPKPVAP